MATKEFIKSVIYNNPAAAYRRSKMRRRLKNTDFSFLVPNCLGGILLHDLGLRFQTPTINLMMTQTDYLEFTIHLCDYLAGEFQFIDGIDKNYPSALLHAQGVKPITIHFTHYSTAAQAEEKWRERANRINYDNLFFFIEERDGITRRDFERLAELPARGIVAFTCNEYKDLPYTVYLPKYHAHGEVGNILKQRYIDGSREYERYFDFVKWFNEANGEPYTVESFCLGHREETNL
jgi:uncharacterized protein (DUF1919 family)